jgi:hypothetical protein
MLLDLRSDLYQENEVEALWKVGLKLWALGNQSPFLFGLGGKLARLATGDQPPRNLPGPLGGWSKYRAFPTFAKKSFREQWKERRGS